jgi:hypothetical protein
VINWEEFKDIQKSYFKASVVDIEVITDHAIKALLFQTAADNGIKYILLGTNSASEQIMPKSWTFNKNDLTNLLSIHKKFGTVELKTFPQLGLEKYLFYTRKMKIQTIPMLEYIDYVKEDAKKLLMEKLKWKDYGGKHYESVFTRFYQGYILPRKFGIDKRKAHYSTLINAKQMTREEALEKLKEPTYSEDLIKKDYQYVIKKLEFSPEEFENIMNAPVKSHFDYATDINSKIDKKYLTPTNPLRKLKRTFGFLAH